MQYNIFRNFPVSEHNCQLSIVNSAQPLGVEDLEKVKRKVGWVFATLLGSALFSAGFALFLMPNEMSSGGISGLAMVIVELLAPHFLEQLGKLLDGHTLSADHTDNIGVLQLTYLLFQLTVFRLQLRNFLLVFLQFCTEPRDFGIHQIITPLGQTSVAVEMRLPIT